MAEIKDKVVTVESLSALYNYNEESYMTKTNPSGNGEMFIDGEGFFSGNIYVNSNLDGNTIVAGMQVMSFEDIIPIENGGTNSADGATGLANLFASGATVLSSYQYGDTLPAAGIAGRIFFKRLTDI